LGSGGRIRTGLVVIPALELNRPDVTTTGPYVLNIHPALVELIPRGTHGIIAGINGWTARQQGNMPLTRPAVIGEGVQARVARQVAGL
jgi:hypothetical protein